MGLSRVEDILQAGLDGTEPPKPLSRVEILLEEWIEASGGASSDAYATAISLTIDSSTYVVTAQLLNKDGDPIGTAQTIDLPLESMVVSGSYDSTTKKVILTLKNGQTVEFSIADLVDGLASQADLDALTARVGTNENNILITDITSNFVAVTGYTITNVSKVYRQGNHVFGHLWVNKNSGNFDNLTIEHCVTNSIDKCAYAYPQEGFFSNSNWKIENFGYVFITEDTKISVRPTVTNCNYAFIKIDYCCS